MESDRQKWNARYHRKRSDPPPAELVRRFWPLARTGRALDIAAGCGQNAVFLAKKGFCVDAVDISDVALAPLTGRHDRLHPICADLDDYVIDPGRYDLIVNIHFLNRNLFDPISAGLAPGGLLIFAAFLQGDGPVQQPARPDYLLEPDELLRAFADLAILYYREQRNVPPIKSSHVAHLVGRKPV